LKKQDVDILIAFILLRVGSAFYGNRLSDYIQGIDFCEQMDNY